MKLQKKEGKTQVIVKPLSLLETNPVIKIFNL